MKDSNKINVTESYVRGDLEKKGYTVVKNDYMTNPGLPDFKCFNFWTGDKFYIEVKRNGKDLSEVQKVTIKDLISKGANVRLAIVHNAEINYFELDKNLNRTSFGVVKLQCKKYTIQTCPNCSHRWESRVENPKSCPRCKRRFDYPGTVKRIVGAKE
jgi:hypothetical protein